MWLLVLSSSSSYVYVIKSWIYACWVLYIIPALFQRWSGWAKPWPKPWPKLKADLWVLNGLGQGFVIQIFIFFFQWRWRSLTDFLTEKLLFLSPGFACDHGYPSEYYHFAFSPQQMQTSWIVLPGLATPRPFSFSSSLLWREVHR